MSDELLPYYDEELRFIRQSGSAFARANPKIAGRLGLGTDSPEDPHVSRMIEAFAYLNARIRHKLDDDFPEITEALLGALYPHYLAPIPAAAIVEFALQRSQAELIAGHRVPRHTALDTEPIEGEPCRFRTCSNVDLWPIAMESATLERPPFQAPRLKVEGDVASVLRLRLQTLSPKVAFRQMTIPRLRFYLGGQAPANRRLYELLRTATLAIGIAEGPGDPNAFALDSESLQPVGFSPEEGLLDYPARSFQGYRLLTEYFAFPEKFLFLDVELPLGALKNIGTTLEIYFYLSRERRDLERGVGAASFRLGCTPIVNLFRRVAEAIRLTHTQYEYRVVPDARRPLAHEVHAIDRVVAVSPNNETTEFAPFYSVRHASEAARKTAYWHATRRPAPPLQGDKDFGTEVYLSLVDLGFRPDEKAGWTLHVETTSLNRNYPSRLCENGPPRLQAVGGGPLMSVRCLTSNMRTLRPKLGQGTRWRLVSHLALNHLSLVDLDRGADALRDILKLYDFADSAETQTLIEGLTGVQARRVVGRIRQHVSGRDSTFFARGLEVTLDFDEDRFTDGGVLLLASVLERFLGLYCSINSFVKTIARTNRREGALFEWPPRAGETVLL